MLLIIYYRYYHAFQQQVNYQDDFHDIKLLRRLHYFSHKTVTRSSLASQPDCILFCCNRRIVAMSHKGSYPIKCTVNNYSNRGIDMEFKRTEEWLNTNPLMDFRWHRLMIIYAVIRSMCLDIDSYLHKIFRDNSLKSSYLSLNVSSEISRFISDISAVTECKYIHAFGFFIPTCI